MRFESINKGYNNVFKPGELTVGLVVPIENYENKAVPSMTDHLQRIQWAESLGFSSIWLRDVPFYVPSFGDAGQMFDPFTYLGFLAARTKDIALGIASVALPLHHPLHVVKAAATIDQLSEGRLIMGIASGDRYDEYPAMHVPFDKRGILFRESYDYIRAAQDTFPEHRSDVFGNLPGHIEVLPKATGHKIPMLTTGFSQQTMDWTAMNSDGWMYYPRNISQQKELIKEWRKKVEDHTEHSKPFMQPLYIDIVDSIEKPIPIHLGFKLSTLHLKNYLENLRDIGVNHVALNLRFNRKPIKETLEEIATEVLPYLINH